MILIKASGKKISNPEKELIETSLEELDGVNNGFFKLCKDSGRQDYLIIAGGENRFIAEYQDSETRKNYRSVNKELSLEQARSLVESFFRESESWHKQIEWTDTSSEVQTLRWGAFGAIVVFGGFGLLLAHFLRGCFG